MDMSWHNEYVIMVVANGDRGVVTGTARQRVYGRFIAETSTVLVVM